MGGVFSFLFIDSLFVNVFLKYMIENSLIDAEKLRSLFLFLYIRLKR